MRCELKWAVGGCLFSGWVRNVSGHLRCARASLPTHWMKCLRKSEPTPDAAEPRCKRRNRHPPSLRCRRSNVPLLPLYPFALLIKFSGSTREADAAQKIFKARVRADRIEASPQQDARVKSLLIAFFEPIHSLIGIPESYIDHRNLRSIRII
jgi:hypothetical protein